MAFDLYTQFLGGLIRDTFISRKKKRLSRDLLPVSKINRKDVILNKSTETVTRLPIKCYIGRVSPIGGKGLWSEGIVPDRHDGFAWPTTRPALHHDHTRKLHLMAKESLQNYSLRYSRQVKIRRCRHFNSLNACYR